MNNLTRIELAKRGWELHLIDFSGLHRGEPTKHYIICQGCGKKIIVTNLPERHDCEKKLNDDT